MDDVQTLEVVVGRIGKPHGIRGEVTIDVRTDEPELRYADGAVLRAVAPRGSAFSLRNLTVTRTRWHQTGAARHLRRVRRPQRGRGRAQRRPARHDPRHAVPEDPDEFYDHQLVGLAAHDLDGVLLGEVTGLVHGGAQDLLAIKAVDGRATLVPFVTALVPEVDLAGRRVVVADRPGLVAPLDED